MCTQNPYMQKAATPVPGPRNLPGPPLNPVAPLPMQVGADEEAAIAARNAQVEAEKMALEGQAQGRQFIDGGAIGREQPSKKGMDQAQGQYDGFRDAISESFGAQPQAPAGQVAAPMQTFGAAKQKGGGARLGAAASDSFTSKKPMQTSGRTVE